MEKNLVYVVTYYSVFQGENDGDEILIFKNKKDKIQQLKGKDIMSKDLTPIQVNYKNIKPYDMSKPPLRQYAFWVHLIRLLSFFATLGLKKKVERINMKGLKPPYFMLSNHMHFVDFELVSLATRNHKVL